MELSLTPDAIGMIVSFIVPGYLAIRAYTLVHTKVEKDFSKLAVESIAYSLLITGLYNAVWRHWFLRHAQDKTLYTTSVKYALPLLALSILIGYLWGRLRSKKPFNAISKWLNLPTPSDDFLADQFGKLQNNEYVTVTLNDGKIFRGVRSQISVYRKDEEQMCAFDYIAWYRKDNGTWDSRNGSLVLGVKDIEYIETNNVLPK